MSVSKLLIALSMGMVLVACAKKGQSVSSTSNPNIREELLFVDSDGCKVKRFYDTDHRYYVVCPRGVEVAPTEWSESCGKNCTTDIGVSGYSR